MVQKCFCKNVGQHNLCSSCVTKNYVINLRAIKFSVRDIPKNVTVDFNYFFKEKKLCEYFFLFKVNIVVTS